MAGFWSGFGQGFSRSFESALDRRERRREFETTLAERRRERLIDLSQRVSERNRSVQQEYDKPAPSLSWLRSRVGQVEGGQTLINAALAAPGQATQLRKIITQAEQSRGKSFTPEELVEQVTAIGVNIDNPEFVETFTQTGDAYDTLMKLATGEEDITEEEYYDALETAATASTPSPSGVTFDVSGEMFRKDLSMEELKGQAEIFKTAVVDIAQRDLPKLADSLGVAEFNEFTENLENYGKDANATYAINSLYFEQANKMLSESGFPSLRDLDQNPYVSLMGSSSESTVRFQGVVSPEMSTSIPSLKQYEGQNVVIYNDGKIEVVNG